MKMLKINSLLAILSLLFFCSCDKSEELIPHSPDQVEETKDLASEVIGSYIGTIVYDGILVQDYTLTISKVDNTNVEYRGQDERMPELRTDLAEAPEISNVDWITQEDTYQLDSVFTFVRNTKHLTIIRADYDVEFYGDKVN